MYKLIPCKTYNEPCYQMSKNNNNIPPGLLQYKVNRNHIINIDTNSIMILHQDFTADNYNWKFISHSKENLLRLTPNTKTGNANKWKILFALCNENTLNNSNYKCIKGVLQNQSNLNEYALMTTIEDVAQVTTIEDVAQVTSINLEEAINTIPKCRLIKSLDNNYKICQCKMVAPPLFWNEFKNRLLY